MKKLLLVITLCLLCAFALTACKKDNHTSNNQSQNDNNPCKSGHSYSDWAETVAPTCTQKGEERRNCKNCNRVETRDVAELGHNYVGEECSRCGYPVPSEGLGFTSNGDGTCYVSGIGSCTDTDVVIPFMSPDGDRVTAIGIWACDNLINLTSLTIPDSVTSIDYGAFSNCTSLTSITIPDNVTSIDKNAFYNTAYYNDESNWENKVLYIGNNLIAAEHTISGNYTVKPGTVNIAYNAFEYCASLTSITIPDSVITIGEYVFQNCRSLTSIEISDSVTIIGKCAFDGCRGLTSITVDENNQNYKSIDGNLYSKDGKTLVSYAIGKTKLNFTVPNTVTAIGDYAFAGCPYLTNITIPGSVNSIGACAFYNCAILESATLDYGVTSIGESAFGECKKLTSIIIPDSVNSIGYRAFYRCSSLKSVTIPAGVTKINQCTFEYCTGLTSITIPDSVTSIYASAFSHTRLTDVYYKGSSAEWARIYVDFGNDNLKKANKTFNYAG